MTRLALRGLLGVLGVLAALLIIPVAAVARMLLGEHDDWDLDEDDVASDDWDGDTEPGVDYDDDDVGEDWDAAKTREYGDETDVAAASNCDHGVTFDLADCCGATAHEVRARYPRLFGECPRGCGYSGIAYASKEHYVWGDW